MSFGRHGSGITDKQAREWLKNVGEDGQIKILREYHLLKQAICADILGAPTGADDWVSRSIQEADRLKRAEIQLRKLIHGGELLFAEVRSEIRTTQCHNCRGSGEVGDSSCCICGGTGRRPL